MRRITVREAKSLLKEELVRLGVPFTKLTARTVSFSDLARDQVVFVKVHGWKPSPAAEDLKTFAAAHGFRVEFTGGGFISGEIISPHPEELEHLRAQLEELWTKACEYEGIPASSKIVRFSRENPYIDKHDKIMRDLMLKQKKFESEVRRVIREAQNKRRRGELGYIYPSPSGPSNPQGLKIWVQADLLSEYNSSTGSYYWVVTIPRRKQPGALTRKPQAFEDSGQSEFRTEDSAREAAADFLRGDFITGRVEGVRPGERSPDRLWLLFEVYAERDTVERKYRYVTIALPPENHKKRKVKQVFEPSLAFYVTANEAVSEGLSWLRNNFVTGRYVD